MLEVLARSVESRVVEGTMRGILDSLTDSLYAAAASSRVMRTYSSLALRPGSFPVPLPISSAVAHRPGASAQVARRSRRPVCRGRQADCWRLAAHSAFFGAFPRISKVSPARADSAVTERTPEPALATRSGRAPSDARSQPRSLGIASGYAEHRSRGAGRTWPGA